MSGEKGVLSDYRVLDMSDEKGMFGARLLADMGADVVRIERPGITLTIDEAEYAYLNTGKRRLDLDIEQEEGRNLFLRLASRADILVETDPTGYLASLGLDYRSLERVNPGLIMASITHFGQSGPYRDLKSCGLVDEAMGGWLSVSGEKDVPLKMPGNQAYHVAGLFAVNGIMLALWQRQATGRGQYIDVSVLECVVATLDHVLVRYFYQGVVPGRQGSLHWNGAFRVFPCRDGHVFLSITQHWETLVEWLDSEGMAEDLKAAKWRDAAESEKGLDHIIEVLERWTRRHTVAELVEQGQLMRFPWGWVMSVPDILRSPQMLARDYFVPLNYRGRSCLVPGAPVKMPASPWQPGREVPEPAGHRTAVLHDWLGL